MAWKELRTQWHELTHVIPSYPTRRPLQDKFRGTALEDLICHLLDPNPTTRFSLEDIKTHPWVQAGLETSSVPPVATAAPRPAPLQEQVQTLRGINTAPVVCGGLAGPGGRAAGL